MKYHVEVLNSLKAGSVDIIHIYCMFEAADSVENMMKLWYPYRDQMKEMMKDDFTLKDGNSVLIFLGGDYHFLDDNMGHQGSSASYPSSLDKVALTHLQNHGNLPHIPKACPADLRSKTDYLENYNETLADGRSNGNMNENGKFHYSVVGPMLFPLRDLDQVVPATLHIMLGIVFLLYNLLLDQCRKMDLEEGFVTVEEQKEKLSQDWEIASLAVQKHENNLKEHGESNHDEQTTSLSSSDV